MLKMAIELDITPDTKRLQSLTEILQIEMETWDLFVRKECNPQGQAHGVPLPMGLGFSPESSVL